MTLPKNKKEPQDIFSCDLVECSKLHRCFLRNLHKYGITLRRPSYESFRRYSELWLPFLARQYEQQRQQQQQQQKQQERTNGNEEDQSKHNLLLDFIAPADIAWLWHCHRLAPYRYARYIEKTFFGNKDGDLYHGIMVLESRYPFVFQMEDNSDNETLYSNDKDGYNSLTNICKRTQEAFAEMYPNESFFLSTSSTIMNGATTRSDIMTLLDGFDVISTCERQASFFWQVSDPNFNKESFLLEGVGNYLKFVRLGTSTGKPKFLVPTYQIDLMWHTHILNSIAKYHQDNIRLNACILEHDDSLNDRTEGGTLDVNFKATQKLWHQVYDEEYRVEGGMYRGEPPEEYFDESWAHQHVAQQQQNDNQNNLLVRGVLNLSHLIGQVGASSVGKKLTDSWMSIDAPSAFLPANKKSTRRNANANPFQEGYVFGKGDKGWGYYNLNTREAYKVVLIRIQNRINGKEDEKCGQTLCILCIVTIPLVISSMEELDKEITELNDLKLVVTKRLNSYGPSADLELPDDVLGRLKSQYNKNDSQMDSNPMFMFYSSSGFYSDAAAACGGGVFAGADSGGASCGGGGCGGGGCGGGGCGA